MKVTLTIETDSPVLHLSAVGRDKAIFAIEVGVKQKAVSLTKLSDNSVIIKDVS